VRGRGHVELHLERTQRDARVLTPRELVNPT
jgi:hypothetical protein